MYGVPTSSLLTLASLQSTVKLLSVANNMQESPVSNFCSQGHFHLISVITIIVSRKYLKSLLQTHPYHIMKLIYDFQVFIMYLCPTAEDVGE